MSALKDAVASAPFSYDRWESRVPELAREFATGKPYRHVCLEDFLDLDDARELMREFPAPGEQRWIHQVHVNERELGKADRSQFPRKIGELVDELQSERFLNLLEKVTGISQLLSDPDLQGGGLHQIERGGFLNIHTDFTTHPRHPKWQRRLNLLLYLNENWRSEWRGQLELWDSAMQYCVKRIEPELNRAVLFDTTGEAFHGHPDPLLCPPGTTRKSIALYYYTQSQGRVRKRATDYRARPADGKWRSFLIWLDKLALRIYTAIRRRIPIPDEVVGRVLRRFFK